MTCQCIHTSVQVATSSLRHAGSWQCYRSNRPHRESCCPWWRIHCRAMSVAQDLTRVFATSQRRTPMPCKLATGCIGIKIAANIKFMTWRSLMNAVLLYCIARNFRQRKISSKRPSGSSSGIYFCQVPVFARLLFHRSVIAPLLIVYLPIHESISYSTLVVIEKISQEFNLVKKLLWRKRQN